jgi:predicted unusual protein kinase regulating ubiquinone biosynthesis (AarF/ABC1/UbiB family)
MFFHYYTNNYHCDTHTGNFLFHKIKPGGYFHYNIYGKDYYLENQGYLWVVWDFGLIEPFQNSKEINNNKFGNIYTEEPITYDYNNIFRMFDWAEEYLTKDFININNLLLKNIINKYKQEFNFSLYKQLSIEILEFLVKNVSSFTTIKPSNLINKTPYIIR